MKGAKPLSIPLNTVNTSMFHNSHAYVIILLEAPTESLYVTDISEVVDDEYEVPILGFIGENVIIYFCG